MNGRLARIVLSVVLVFALGAITPTFAGAQRRHHATHHAKKKKKKRKKSTSVRGPQGPQGIRGPGGANGSNGPPGANGTGPAFGAFQGSSVLITSKSSSTPTVVATLAGLPAGAYAIFAKTVLNTAASVDHLIVCHLNAGDDFDESSAYMGTASTGDVFRANLSMQVIHTYATGGSTATVVCWDEDGTPPSGLFARNTKITAIQVTSATNSAG